MWGRLILIIGGSAVAAVTFVSPSKAEFRVCNKAKEKIDVAFGYDGGRRGFIAEGWYVLDIGKCTTVKGGTLQLRYYYLYGRGYDGTEWDGSDDENAGPFCVKDGSKFTLFQNRYGDDEEEDCKKAGLQSKSFFRVDVGDNSTWTHTLDPEAVAAPSPKPSPPPPNRPNPPPANPNGGGNACQRFPNLC
jgi:uncharacterized membrane protein